jgi:hypothetical protein
MIAYAYFTLLLSLTSTSASPIKRANNQLIVSSRDQKCLSPAGGAAAVAAGQITNGTPLVSMDCAQAAGWDISPGSGSVVLTGTSYAMDAGSNPGNNGQLKVCLALFDITRTMSCRNLKLTHVVDLDFVPWSTQQTWYLTADGRIAITGGTQCLDEGTNGMSCFSFFVPFLPHISSSSILILDWLLCDTLQATTLHAYL